MMMSHIDPEQNVYEPENALLWVSVGYCVFYVVSVSIIYLGLVHNLLPTIAWFI